MRLRSLVGLLPALCLLTLVATAGRALGQTAQPPQRLPQPILLDQSAGAPWDGGFPTDVDDTGRVVGRGQLNGAPLSYEWTASGGFAQISTPYVGVGRINSLGDLIYPLNPLVLTTGTEVWIPNVLGTTQGVALNDLNDSLLVVGSAPGSGTTSDILVWDPVQGSRSYFVHAAEGLDRVNQGTLAVGNAVVHDSASDGFVLDLTTGLATTFNAILPSGPTTWSVAVDVSNPGVVVGEGSDGVSLAAFTWSAATGFRFLPGLKGGETMRVHPRAIDDRGRVVGKAMTAKGEWRAFLWDPVIGMRDLNDIAHAPSGFVLREARDISETGVVIGWGTYPGEVLPQVGFILPLN